jgi:signal transduction histidine kinase
MHERVRLVKGEIAVRSQPGEGTRVVVKIQVPRSHQP